MNAHITTGILPFLKWAGGKRWLVSAHDHLLPSEFGKYYEPFLGSGAVFFHLKPRVGILSDANAELIATYNAIKCDAIGVEELLKRHHKNHSKDYYYKVRESKPRSLNGHAAKFIYLNRTCWNGLYRVNLNGVFNVPIGTKKNVILDSDNFQNVAKVLKNIKIIHSDFEKVIDKAGYQDFVFIDPPYTVKHNLNGFVKYNENLFSWDDQIRLRDAVGRAIARGAKVLVLNADHQSVHELYAGMGEYLHLDRSSVISGLSQFRGRYGELAVKCY